MKGGDKDDPFVQCFTGGRDKAFLIHQGVLKEKDGNEYYFYVSINFPFLKRHLSKWGMYFDGSIKV
jgi:hypothetical protein